jgi:hypothetical protein
MGTLDDAIREHLELKRSKGAPEDELKQKEAEAFGGAGAPARPAPPEPAPPEHEPAAEPAEPPAWEPDSTADDLLDPDEVLPEESLEPNGTMPRRVEDELPSEELALDEPEPLEADEPVEQWETESEPSEDLLEETPDFLEETPEHDRLWFEQKPPKDFDFD